MSAAEVAIAIVGSASALYGFSIAYYAFARTLSRQEERWLREDSRTHAPLVYGDGLHNGLHGIAMRRLALNLLLIGATVSFVPSLLGGLWYLSDSNSNPCALVFTEISFGILVAGVVAYFFLVGILNIRDTYRDILVPAKGTSK